jgi:CubicO group peptidase (beta-lactamase class C family)
MDPTVDWAGGGLVSTAADLAAFLRALTRGQLVSAGAWREMTRWQPGPEGFDDDYGLGLGRYRFAPAGYDQPGLRRLIDMARIDEASSVGELAADLELTGGGWPGRPTGLSALTVTAAIGVALLPPAAARHNRR